MKNFMITSSLFVKCSLAALAIMTICLPMPAFSSDLIPTDGSVKVMDWPPIEKQIILEKDYVNLYCTGEREVVLQDNTRVDCWDDEAVWEFEMAHKWYEAVGQSLHYATLTGKTPGIALIIDSDKDRKRLEALNAVILKFNLPIKVISIKR